MKRIPIGLKIAFIFVVCIIFMVAKTMLTESVGETPQQREYAEENYPEGEYNQDYEEEEYEAATRPKQLKSLEETIIPMAGVDMEAVRMGNVDNPTSELTVSRNSTGETVKETADSFAKFGICKALDYALIYENNSASSDAIGRLFRGSGAKVLKNRGDWLQISSGGIKGFIRANSLALNEEALGIAPQFQKTVAYVKAGKKYKNLVVRNKPNKKGKKIKTIVSGKIGDLLDESGAWVKVALGESNAGYVPRSSITLKGEYDIAVSVDRYEGSDDDDEGAYLPSTGQRGIDICTLAKRYVGNPYVWGGNSFTHGIDCSGFTKKLYGKYGIEIPRTAATQCASNKGKQVSFSNMEPGDLIFYKHGNRVGHVALYIGNGKICHAACRRLGIIISKYNYRQPYMAKRFF